MGLCKRFVRSEVICVLVNPIRADIGFTAGASTTLLIVLNGCSGLFSTPISNLSVETNGGGRRFGSFFTRLRGAVRLYGTGFLWALPALCGVREI